MRIFNGFVMSATVVGHEHSAVVLFLYKLPATVYAWKTYNGNSVSVKSSKPFYSFDVWKHHPEKTAIQFLGFQIDTYIVVVLFPGSTDSHIEKMGAVLALKTITGQRIVIGNKIFHCLIPVIDKAVRISYPVL